MSEQVQRTVVVTGGSKGIGRSICLAFAEAGARIFFNYSSDTAAAEETEQMIRNAGGEAVGIQGSVASEEAVKSFFAKVMDEAGRIDVLVNNAGITRDTLLMRMSEQEWDAVIQVNLKSVFNCTQAVMRAMMKERYGRIVNISSVVGQIGNAGQANYSASKAGIMGFTKTVAREVAPRGITVNAVAPGFIDTEMTAVLPEKVRESFKEQIPLGRMGKPDDVAQAVYWLCSEDAGYITGQVIHVNGGMYM